MRSCIQRIGQAHPLCVLCTPLMCAVRWSAPAVLQLCERLSFVMYHSSPARQTGCAIWAQPVYTSACTFEAGNCIPARGARCSSCMHWLRQGRTASLKHHVCLSIFPEQHVSLPSNPCLSAHCLFFRQHPSLPACMHVLRLASLDSVSCRAFAR